MRVHTAFGRNPLSWQGLFLGRPWSAALLGITSWYTPDVRQPVAQPASVPVALLATT